MMMWMVNGVKYVYEGFLVWIILWMMGLLVSGVLCYFVQVVCYVLVQFVVGFGSICLVGWEVVIVVWCEMVVNGFVVGFVESIDYVEYVVVDVGVKVVDMYFGFVSQFFYGCDVVIGEVYYMDVIVYVGIIFGWIVVIKNGQ